MPLKRYASVHSTIRPGEHVHSLTPPWGGEPLIPDQLFKTTGEAIMKTKELIKQINALRVSILAHPPTPELGLFGRECNRSLVEARAFMALLITLRGDFTHLECEWSNDGCCCKLRTVMARSDERSNWGMGKAHHKHKSKVPICQQTE